MSRVINSTSQKNYVRDPPFKRFCPLGDPSIVFKEEEVEHLNLDHDDALVVSLRIVNAFLKIGLSV